MNKIIVLLSISILLSFSYGIIAGHYEIFPFQQLSILKSTISNYEDPPPYPIDHIYQNDIPSLIHIQNPNDINEKRKQLIDFIWKNKGLPTTEPIVNIRISDPAFSSTSNLKQLDSFTIEMEHGVNSIAYFFTPNESNNELIIFHQGHNNQQFSDDYHNVESLLNEGYSILLLVMVTHGLNNEPIVDFPEFGKVKLESHDYFKFLETESFSPISYFLDPIVISLNYIEKHYAFDSYHMIGFEGGGWTTVLYTAIDPRIDHSYSIAGSIPIYLRYTPSTNFGDFEQTLPELYRIANYLDLYIMDSYGENRKFVQIFNKYDPCCFSGEFYKTYYSSIQSVVSQLPSGSFEIFLDDSHKEHKISNIALDYIINSLKNTDN